MFSFILPSPPLCQYQITYIASDFQHFPIWINLHLERGCELNCYKRLRCSANLLVCSFKHQMLFLLRKLSENFLHLETSLIAQLIYQMQNMTYTNEGIHSNTSPAAVRGSVILWPTVRYCCLQGYFSLRKTQLLQECRMQGKSQKQTRRQAEDRVHTKLLQLTQSELAAFGLNCSKQSKVSSWA